MITEFVNRIKVMFPTVKEANEALAFMRAKLKESIGHWVSVCDLIGCCSLTPDFVYRFTSKELNEWGWTSIDGFSLEKGPHRGTCILTMPPARKRGMINPNLRPIMEEKYYPLTPPPQLYIPRGDGKSMKSLKTEMRYCDEICGYSMPNKLIHVPTKEEIIKDIRVYTEYDVVRDVYIYRFVYEDKNNSDIKATQTYTVSAGERIMRDVEAMDCWSMAKRELLANYVMKTYEAKKKKREKETMKMPFYTHDEIEKMMLAYTYKPAKTFTISNIEMYNDRVVKVTFNDGSFTKSVCQENDIFDLDVGITVCLIKKMLDDGKGNGTKIYNDLIRGAHKLIEDKENEKIREQLEKEKHKKKARKTQMKRQAKKLKAKEEAIDIQKLAFIRAMQETGMVNDGK